jgi:DEAD/DEAH box helicase domain-containing protein
MQTTRATEPWADIINAHDERLVHQELQPSQEATTAEIPPELAPALGHALRANKGIDSLYAHQLEALLSAFRQQTIVTTGTSSGKSLCFQLPTLQTLLQDRHAKALFLYPTKALAQDQAKSLHEFGLHRHIRQAIYDGDTPKPERAQIRKKSNLVITNPDMLHVGVLPNHPAWADFLANLSFVVVDEAHVYRGVFGSHVANVLRRLRRLANIYGAEPRFLLTSATIANPTELATNLTGHADYELIQDDAAPKHKRRIAMWNPPMVDEQLGTRESALYAAAELLTNLIRRHIRTICFMKSRKGVELILKHTVTRLGSSDLAKRVAPYRGGYTAAQRREIEHRLSSGELLAVVATDALELGIDIGELDAAICVTFPGTVASLKQMWGRAGRRSNGLAIYVAGEDALDQFFCRHPEEFLRRPVEAAILDPHSPEIHLPHLLCAAHEAPITAEDAATLGEQTLENANQLAAQKHLRERATGYVPADPGDYPATRVALRSSTAESIALIDTGSGEVIGQIEVGRAFSTVHDGAIYLHLGTSYVVQHLDLHNGSAYLERHDGDYFTQAKREIMTFIDRLETQRHTQGIRLSFGEAVYTETVIGYQRKRLDDHEIIDFESLDLPTTEFRTKALWYELGELINTEPFPPDALLGSLHALEHGQIAVLPLIAMCDRWDIGGLSTNAHPQTQQPTIFIYDGHPGGVGITKRGYEQFERLVQDAGRLIGECRCDHGCPSCVQSPKCGNLNEPLSKRGALELITRLQASSLGRDRSQHV